MMSQHDFVMAGLDGVDYDYKDNGDSWLTTEGMEACTGTRQSPIDLTTKMDKAEVEETYFKHYENVVTFGDTSDKDLQEKTYGYYGSVQFKGKTSSTLYVTLDFEDLGKANLATPVPKAPFW